MKRADLRPDVAPEHNPSERRTNHRMRRHACEPGERPAPAVDHRPLDRADTHGLDDRAFVGGQPGERVGRELGEIEVMTGEVARVSRTVHREPAAPDPVRRREGLHVPLAVGFVVREAFELRVHRRIAELRDRGHEREPDVAVRDREDGAGERRARRGCERVTQDRLGGMRQQARREAE